MDNEDRLLRMTLLLAGFVIFLLTAVMIWTYLIDKYAENQTAREAINNGYVQQHVEGRSRPIWVKPDNQ